MQTTIDKIKYAVLQINADAEVYLYGSRAWQDAKADSDWDILILLNNAHTTLKEEKEYRSRLYDISLDIGQHISTYVFSKNEWHKKFSITPLYKNVSSEAVKL